MATIGELDGVAGQVDQHLTQAIGVAFDEGRHIVGDDEPQIDALLAGTRRQDRQHALHDLAQDERRGHQIEMSRLDLREVEDVVDDGEQRIAADANRLGAIALLRGQR